MIFGVPGPHDDAAGAPSSSVTLRRHQGVAGDRAVVEHRPAGRRRRQLGVQEHLQVAAHRAQALAGQRHQLRRALR